MGKTESAKTHLARLMPFLGLGREGRRNQIPTSRAFGRLALPNENGGTTVVTHQPGNSLHLHEEES